MTQGTLGAQLPSVMALAYLGDAEHTRHVRHHLVAQGISASGELHRRSLAYVTAQRQAAVMRHLEPTLCEAEADVFRRARNHAGLSHPRHASVMEYRYATGFEAVLGLLAYTHQRERLAELLDEAVRFVDAADAE